MDILTLQSNEELNKAAAALIGNLLQTKPDAVLGLATGDTPIGIYEELVNLYCGHQISFHSATTFNLDEYVGLRRDHEQSYYAYMHKYLFQHVDLPAQSAHIPDGSAENIERECRRYDQLLQEIKQIDLQILGLGHNGHIGFNEPNHALVSGTHVVQLRQETRSANARYFATLDDVPTHAITMGIGTILKAKTILLVVRGAGKAKIVHQALVGPITTECPASLLQTHPNLVVMLDSEAGELFK